ncbi:hypothetical protein RIF29_19115 [Crotalaria pallida]|uniref:Uncharacterized protein n=1 Tax=Crotalaria pallida TaxID=3830 RepID=A0AAN9IB50_CROPI
MQSSFGFISWLLLRKKRNFLFVVIAFRNMEFKVDDNNKAASKANDITSSDESSGELTEDYLDQVLLILLAPVWCIRFVWLLVSGVLLSKAYVSVGLITKAEPL